MLAIVVTVALSVPIAPTAPVASPLEDGGVHAKITAETGLTFSVLGSLVRRSIISTDSPYGFAVKSVRAGSRGDRAGISRGDILLKWDGRPIRTLETLWEWIGEEESGAEVSIETARRKPTRSILDRHPWETHDLQIRVGRPGLFQETGIELDFLDSWFRRSRRPEQHGFKVGAVAPGSPAEAIGIRSGDILLEWKGRPIVSFAELEEWIGEDLPGGEVEVGYARRVGGKFSWDPWDARTGTLVLKE